MRNYDESVSDSLEKEEPYEVFNKPGSTSLIARLSNFILNHLEKKHKRITAEIKRKVVKEAGELYLKSLKRLLPSGELATSAVNLLCVLENRQKTKNRAPKRSESAKASVASSLPLHERKRFNEIIDLTDNSLPDPMLTEEEATDSKRYNPL